MVQFRTSRQHGIKQHGIVEAQAKKQGQEARVNDTVQEDTRLQGDNRGRGWSKEKRKN